MARDVLIVDDDAALLDVIRRFLEGEGYQVLTANDGDRAQALILQSQPGMVLLDLNMPRLSGWEVQAWMQALHPAIPVVFMTAREHAFDQAERYGAAASLAKPFDLDDLLRVVSRFVGPPDPQ